jgi:hypothetical protein
MASNILKKPDGDLSFKTPVRQIHIPDQEKYQNILDDMIMAFFQQRKGCETQQSTDKYCRSVLDTCLTGFHRDGRLWKNAPGKDAKDWYEALQIRLRVFKYDMVNRKLIPSGRKSATQRIRDKAKEEKKEELTYKGTTERVFAPAEKDDFKRFQQQFLED